MNTGDRGEKILHFQKLYQEYSHLGLKYATDRPLAIDGLQARILGALKAHGGFGVFDEEKEQMYGHSKGRGLLPRSLLWCRDPRTERLSRLAFSPDHAISKVPSWSWVAYDGGIGYLSPGFGHVDWVALESPWFPTLKPDKISLTAFDARPYHGRGGAGEDGARLHLMTETKALSNRAHASSQARRGSRRIQDRAMRWGETATSW